MVRQRSDLGRTSKSLNQSLHRFSDRSGSLNLGLSNIIISRALLSLRAAINPGFALLLERHYPHIAPGEVSPTTTVAEGLFTYDKTAFPNSFGLQLLQERARETGQAVLELTTVDDILVLSFAYDGDMLSDLKTVQKIVSTFVENKKHVTVFSTAHNNCSVVLLRCMTKTVYA
ncbi:hypothetical protein PIB30_037301 [Stylosanthes scabra]|uniref:Uncharacterized protein n=1 Tax=Stylosanthes scabra TaxID=79078 RepID=A0ABU6YC19_9FABA|nr:hypothetical protein [Stylosanthes scabra]